jgi:hypothetical protein
MAMAKKLYKLTNFSTTAVTVTRSRPHDADDAFRLLEPIMVLQKVRLAPAGASPAVPALVGAQPQSRPAGSATLS